MKNKLIYLVAYLILLEAGSYCFLRFFTNYDLRSRPLEIFNTESPILSFGVKKNFSQRFVRREFDVRVKTNNIGLRENEPYNGEKIDIAFAGDSFVFGHGVNAGERFSDLLRPHFPGKNILSLAYLNGWTAPHYYLFLKYNPQWVPELLIMELYLGCDLRSDIEETNFVFDTNNQLLSAKSLRRFVDSRGMFTADHGWFYRLADSIFTGKAVLVGYGILKKMLGNPGARDDGYSPLVSIDPFHQGKLNDTTGLDYILKTRKLLEERQSELVVFIIPKSFMIGQYRSCPYSEEVCQEIQEHKRLQRSITRWLGDHGVEFIDPTDKMIELERNGVRLYFEQDEHWNQQGHKAAAEILHRYLRDRVA